MVFERLVENVKNFMKIFLLILCFMPLTAFANPLSHSKWEDESASKCPTVIFFGAKKYIFINRCYSPRKDGVVERGIYAVSGESLSLSNRLVIAAEQFELIPREVNQIRILSLTVERLELSVGGKTKPFKRLFPGQSNKPKQQAIKFFPSRIDAVPSPAHYF